MWSVAPNNAADRAAARSGGAPGIKAVPMSKTAMSPQGGPGLQKKLQVPTVAAAPRPGGAGPFGMVGAPGAKGLAQRPAGPTLLTGVRPQQPQGKPQDEGNEVAAFLKELGLSQYTDAMLATGFDEMDTLLHIEDADMKEMGINACHVVKLRRRLQELQRQAGGFAELDESNPVVAFLKDIGLPQYAEPLLQSGFDELESLMDIEDNDMKDLGIPRGHAVKIKRRLREYQDPQESSQQPAAAKAHHHAAGRRAAPVVVSQAVIEHGPMPDDHMKTAVERSWEKVQAIGSDTVGEMLYRHTFALEPSLMNLFPVEVRRKYRDWTADERADESDLFDSPALRKLFSKFVNAIGCTVAGLHDFGRLVPMLTQLGTRHAGYGLSESHWPIMGKALIYTLRDCLADDFTSEVESAWSMVYGFMSNIMIEGLRGQLARARKTSTHVSSVDDDTVSERSSLPSELDGGSKEPWKRQTTDVGGEDGLHEEDALRDSNEGADL